MKLESEESQVFSVTCSFETSRVILSLQYPKNTPAFLGRLWDITSGARRLEGIENSVSERYRAPSTNGSEFAAWAFIPWECVSACEGYLHSLLSQNFVFRSHGDCRVLSPTALSRSIHQGQGYSRIFGLFRPLTTYHVTSFSRSHRTLVSLGSEEQQNSGNILFHFALKIFVRQYFRNQNLHVGRKKLIHNEWNASEWGKTVHFFKMHFVYFSISSWKCNVKI